MLNHYFVTIFIRNKINIINQKLKHFFECLHKLHSTMLNLILFTVPINIHLLEKFFFSMKNCNFFKEQSKLKIIRDAIFYLAIFSNYKLYKILFYEYCNLIYHIKNIKIVYCLS